MNVTSTARQMPAPTISGSSNVRPNSEASSGSQVAITSPVQSSTGDNSSVPTLASARNQPVEVSFPGGNPEAAGSRADGNAPVPPNSEASRESRRIQWGGSAGVTRETTTTEDTATGENTTTTRSTAGVAVNFGRDPSRDNNGQVLGIRGNVYVGRSQNDTTTADGEQRTETRSRVGGGFTLGNSAEQMTNAERTLGQATR